MVGILSCVGVGKRGSLEALSGSLEVLRHRPEVRRSGSLEASSGSPEVRRSGSPGRSLIFLLVEVFVAAAERLGPFYSIDMCG